MYLKPILIFAVLIWSSNCHIYYPDDDGNIQYPYSTFPSHPQGSNAQKASTHYPSNYGQPERTPPPQIEAEDVPAYINETRHHLQKEQSYEQYVENVISSGVLQLTLAIRRTLDMQYGKNYDNIVFAPLSISGALALVLLGSNGKTFKEVTTLMGLATGVLDIDKKSRLVHEHLSRMMAKLGETSGIDLAKQVRFAAAVFVQDKYPIREVYKDTAERLYNSEVLNLDFHKNPTTAQKSINAWVSDRTNGKISEILSEPPPTTTKVLIASALYFIAEWEYPFFPESTKKRPFFTNGRKQPSTVQTDMMANGGNFPYYKDRTLNCEILGFPYKGNKTTMYVVMPGNSNVERLKELENKLTADHLERLVTNTKYTRSVILFPKMLIESTIDLSTTLEMLGLGSLFSPTEANLALLSPGLAATTRHKIQPNLGPVVSNPLSARDDNMDTDSVLIFSRMGETVKCSEIFDPRSNITECHQVVENTSQTVTYKKIDGKIGRRVARDAQYEDIDSVRQFINQQPNANNYENPGLYADKIIHKVYMHITETGTEAAAVTAISLGRDGNRIVFRVDVPFFFFIRNEETGTVMFWGSVNTPTPNYKL